MLDVKTTSKSEIAIPKVGTPQFEEILLAGVRALAARAGQEDIPPEAKVVTRVYMETVRDGGGVTETTSTRPAVSIKVVW